MLVKTDHHLSLWPTHAAGHLSPIAAIALGDPAHSRRFGMSAARWPVGVELPVSRAWPRLALALLRARGERTTDQPRSGPRRARHGQGRGQAPRGWQGTSRRNGPIPPYEQAIAWSRRLSMRRLSDAGVQRYSTLPREDAGGKARL